MRVRSVSPPSVPRAAMIRLPTDPTLIPSTPVKAEGTGVSVAHVVGFWPTAKLGWGMASSCSASGCVKESPQAAATTAAMVREMALRMGGSRG